MQKKNNLFSAENANEGALHVLFYLALFISEKTPSFFAIDNIETALNPMLCRHLMTRITELAKKHQKQVLITTHNPAILDGLNLHDPEQHLFVVKRTDEGHTKVERIKLKPDVENESLKLSELWMRGYLGALPSNIF
jgi:predicted ATPase